MTKKPVDWAIKNQNKQTVCESSKNISIEHEFSIAHQNKMLHVMIFLAFKLSDVVSILQINVKRPTIVDMLTILTFMSRVNFMLS